MINFFKPHKILRFVNESFCYDLDDAPTDNNRNHQVIVSPWKLDGYSGEDWPCGRQYAITFIDCLIRGELYDYRKSQDPLEELSKKYPGKQFDYFESKKSFFASKKYKVYLFDDEWGTAYYVALDAKVKDMSGTTERIRLSLRPYFKKMHRRLLPYTDYLRLLVLKRKLKRLNKS